MHGKGVVEVSGGLECRDDVWGGEYQVLYCCCFELMDGISGW